MAEGELIRYDEMCRAIDACYEVDEVQEIRNKAHALEQYMRQSRNMEAERRACEIRLRAERKGGNLLKELKRAQGERTDVGTSVQPEPKSFQAQLDNLGISKTQARRMQQLAEVPEDEFEAALAAPEKPSTTGIINAHWEPKEEPMNPKALWLWGRLRDFERDGLLDEDPRAILSEMTEAMQADVRRLIDPVTQWLEGAINE